MEEQYYTPIEMNCCMTSEEVREKIYSLTRIKFSKSECRKHTLKKILTIAQKIETQKEMVEEGLDGY